MRNIPLRISPAFACSLAFSVSACGGYEIRPTAPQTPPRAASTLPLRAAVVFRSPQAWKASPQDPGGISDQKEQCASRDSKPADVCRARSEDQQAELHWEADAHKLGERFAQTLSSSGLFRSVAFPYSPSAAGAERPDVVVVMGAPARSWEFDQPIFPFLPFCDPLLIGCPAVKEYQNFAEKAEVTTTDAAGREIKKYAREIKVVASLGMTAVDPVTMAAAAAEGSSSADKNLVVALVQALIDDAASYRSIAPAEAPPAAEETPAVSAAPAAAGSAWWSR